MSLKRQLEREVVRKFPPFLYSLALTIYWRVHPLRENVILIPKGDFIYFIGEDMELLHPIKRGGLLSGIQKPAHYRGFCSLEEGSIAVDAGAAIGTDTLVLSKEVGESGRIISIEPVPSNVNLLKENLKLNDVKNVDVVEKGLWSEDGSSNIYIGDTLRSHSLIKEGLLKIEDKVKIQTDTLDNTLSELGLEDERIGLLKMNIEGAEVEALKGSKRTLRNTKKVLVQAHRRKKFDTTNEVIQILKSGGFKISRQNPNNNWIYALRN